MGVQIYDDPHEASDTLKGGIEIATERVFGTEVDIITYTDYRGKPQCYDLFVVCEDGNEHLNPNESLLTLPTTDLIARYLLDYQSGLHSCR